MVISKDYAKFKTEILLLAFFLLVIIYSFFEMLPTSFINQYRSQQKIKLEPIKKITLVTEKDLEHLPLCVSRYLKYVNVVGKPKTENFEVHFRGYMKFKPKAKPINIEAEQTSVISNSTRIFLINSKLFGIPFKGLHLFTDSFAFMKIKLASILQVVNIQNEIMLQSETVTFFNDMCLLAPSTLINQNIKWEEIDQYSAKATFTLNKVTISAVLEFNKEDQLINFVSKDRYYQTKENDYKLVQWSTPIEKYHTVNDQNLTKKASAIWSLPNEEFKYADFEIIKFQSNVKK
ncbi:hypothetical protein M0813_12218 [Anaeramoeba flamelloides]|uniref:Uncharacterized protein n=1 Tax=Anaeramoeba flamelloides TaxID=1746091 RepID=A0ABQ8ZCJ8_9EUKA|nr:hypothetical protein M0813_12218 [Anaeramoeba flamelloides]